MTTGTTVTTELPLARRHHASPLGRLTLVASDAGLRALLLPGERPDRVRLGPVGDDPGAAPRHRILASACHQLDEYFGGRRTEFDVPLDPRGTEFQLRAWQALRAIPYGETATYAEQARRIGSPSAVRAVGAANGRNPLSIVVPCHRVVGADGSLTGYAGGVEAKRFLLSLEGGEPPSLFG